MFIYRKKKSVKEEAATEGKKACALQASGLTVGSRDFHGRVGVPGFGVTVSGHLSCCGAVFCVRKVLGSGGVRPLTELPDS